MQNVSNMKKDLASEINLPILKKYLTSYCALTHDLLAEEGVEAAFLFFFFNQSSNVDFQSVTMSNTKCDALRLMCVKKL